MPETGESKAVAAKSRQRESAKRATFEILKAKSPPRAEFEAPLGPDGARVSFLFYAIGAQDYDKLVTACPPRPEQLAQGASYDVNRFAPALLAKVCQDPALSQGEWSQLWNSPTWSLGEVNDLFSRAASLCLQGVDLTPIEAG